MKTTQLINLFYAEMKEMVIIDTVNSANGINTVIYNMTSNIICNVFNRNNKVEIEQNIECTPKVIKGLNEYIQTPIQLR